jgi:hypothetical protein
VDGGGRQLTRYLLFGVLALPAAAFAQARPPASRPAPIRAKAPDDRARISINLGMESAIPTFTSTTTPSVYQETATVNASYRVPAGVFVDGGVIVRVGRSGFGLGAAVSSFTKSETASVTGTIPHPFFFNTPRAVSGTTSPLERSETAVHLQAAFIAKSKRRDVVIAGGPSFFNVSHDLVGNVTYTETYPYDTVAFTGATAAKASASKIGFNAGVDIGVKLSRNFGVGGVVRFSRATVNLPLANTTSRVNVDAGGVQAGGGVRFFF